MRNFNELMEHIPKCVGYDGQGLWSSVSPIGKDGYFGFVYALELLDYYYIGKKQFISERKLLRSGKKKKVTQESNWKTYTSSSKDVNSILKDCGDVCSYYHLHSWKSKKTLQTAEQLTINNMKFITEMRPDNPDVRLFLNGWSDKIFACSRPEDLEELRTVFS